LNAQLQVHFLQFSRLSFQGGVDGPHTVIEDSSCMHQLQYNIKIPAETCCPSSLPSFLRPQDGLYSNKPSIKSQNFDEIAEDSTFLKIRCFPILGLEFEAESEQLSFNTCPSTSPPVQF